MNCMVYILFKNEQTCYQRFLKLPINHGILCIMFFLQYNLIIKILYTRRKLGKLNTLNSMHPQLFRITTKKS